MNSVSRMQLSISKILENQTLQLVLDGQLVATSVGLLREAAYEAETLEARQLTLIMAGVDQIDSHGIGLLAGLYRHFLDRMIGFRLKDVRPEVERTLKICNLFALLDASQPAVTEQELERRRMRFYSFAQQMMEALGEGLLGLDPAGNLLFLNSAAERILHCSEANLLGKNYQGHLQLSNADGSHFAFDEFLTAMSRNGAKRSNHAEVRVQLERGDSRLVQLNAARVFDQGEFLGILLGVVDLRDRELAQQALLRNARLEATSTLAGGLAHDMNNLMFVALAATEMLKQDLCDRTDCLELLSHIEKAGRRASELSEQILAYSGGGKGYVQRINVNQAAESAVQSFMSTNPTLKIASSYCRSLRMISADKRQIDQIVHALLLNAIEATSERGRIWIKTENVKLSEDRIDPASGLRAGYYVRLTVRDSGAGMKPEVLEHALEPFFTTKMIGRGMGLAAVNGIVQNYRGSMKIKSGEGDGTSVTVLLPATLFKARQASPNDATPATGLRPSVLLLQENEIERLATQVMLERQGLHVQSASWSVEAVEILSSSTEFSIALLDLDHLSADPLDVFETLKRMRPKMRIILATHEQLDRGTLALADGFLRKPYGSNQFLQAISQLLN